MLWSEAPDALNFGSAPVFRYTPRATRKIRAAVGCRCSRGWEFIPFSSSNSLLKNTCNRLLSEERNPRTLIHLRMKIRKRRMNFTAEKSHVPSPKPHVPFHFYEQLARFINIGKKARFRRFSPR
jgi:hypothetical protein